MRLEHADRLAGLDQQRFVGLQVPQGVENPVEALPVARRAADAAVHHQMLRVLGDVRVEVVLDHAVGGLDQPVLAVQLRAARGVDDAAGVDAWIGKCVHATSSVGLGGW